MIYPQVGSLMADKQKLAAQCSSLQRENEQLVELVGYLSLEQQQLLEQQHQLQKVLLNTQSGELVDDGSWSVDHHHQQQRVLLQKQQALALLPDEQQELADLAEEDMTHPASSTSSMEAVYLDTVEL